MNIMEETTVPKLSTYKKQLISRVEEVITPRESACDICHVIGEERSVSSG